MNQHRTTEPGDDLLGALVAGEFLIAVAPFKGKNLLILRRQASHAHPFITRMSVNMVDVAERKRFFL